MTQTTAVRVESILESHLHLIPLMVGVDGESADIGGMTEAAQKIAAEIDALTRERDEARAEVATLTLKLANARLNLKHCSEEVDKRDECAGQLAESRAEVESCRKAYAQMRSTEDEWKRDTLAALKAEVERLRPAAWSQVFELQAKHAATWRDRDESYWLARFMEEVGELAGALVGNHVGPVEWELTQLAAIALNWLDMRAARARAAKEAKP